MLKNDTPKDLWPYTILLKAKKSISETELIDASLFDASVDLPIDAEYLEEIIVEALKEGKKWDLSTCLGFTCPI